MKELSTIAAVAAGAGVLGVVVWVLATLGRALIKVAEALAAAAAVLFAGWLMVTVVVWAFRQTVTHWRTSLSVVAGLAWWQWRGWASLVITTGVVTGVLIAWRLVDLRSFDAWGGSASAVVVAALVGVRRQAARLVAVLRSGYEGGGRLGGGDGEPASAQLASQPQAGPGPVAPGAFGRVVG